ncbi:MAG: Na+/glucose cotransporter, partial [Ignavibacterium sp.]
KGCLAALVTGFALGLFRLIVDTPVTLKLPGFEFGYPVGSLFWIVNNTYFQYYSLFIFVISVIVMIAVSYMTEKPSEAQLKDLTFGTLSEDHRVESRSSWNKWDVINSTLVLLLILAAYLTFTG